jgi:DNA-binding winged helix-turn-helix (wHTH) protein
MTVKRGGSRVDIEPKVFDVLRFLLTHRDRLVTKEELLDGVWPGTFVAPNALTRAVAQLRKALGDDADEPRYIETVAKRGYRFIAPVVTDGGTGVVAAQQRPRRRGAGPSVARPPPRHWRPWLSDWSCGSWAGRAARRARRDQRPDTCFRASPGWG